MMAAQNRMIAIAAVKTAVTRCRHFASMTGTRPAFSPSRQDKKSMVGIVDNSAATMNSENFVKKA